MGEYKCISCGATKNSEKTCSCAECGYKMYETPYERRELLRSEIRNFIARHKYVRVKPDDFEVFRNVPTGKDKETEEDRYKYVPKKEDDKRFPPFKDIQKYVCAATKTEIFHERLNSSLDQIRKHITTPYAQSYCVSFNCIKKDLEPLDSVLKEILKELGIQKPLPEASLPDIVMDYSETPDTALTDMAENILGALGALADEIKLFIRKNNIYGTSYREVRKISDW